MNLRITAAQLPGSPARNLAGALLMGAAVAMLAACGGGGGGGGGGGTTTPPSPPPPPPGTASSYYLSGEFGLLNNNGSLSLTGVAASGAATVTIPDSNLYTGTLATVAEWTASGGSATSAGVRFRLWSGSDGNVYNTDLGVMSGATAPTTTRLSTYASASTCPGGASVKVLNDLARPLNSAVVFRQPSSGGCGFTTDTFVAIPLSATASTALPAASSNEPVDVARDATGAIQKVVFLIHGSGNTASLGVASSITATPTVLGTTIGNGLNLPGNQGDFNSLAVVPQADGSYVWVYRDFNKIFAVNISTAAAPVKVYDIADEDTIQTPAAIDGTTVYLAMSDTTNNPSGSVPPQYTCQLVRINTVAPLSASSGSLVLQENTLGTGISLVGVWGSNLVYFNDNVVTTTTSGNTTYSGAKNLEYVAKSTPGTIGNGTVIAPATYPNVFDATSPPVIAGNVLYYTIDNPTGGVGGSIGYQTYALTTGQPTAIGSNGSILLGGVSATPVTTANPGALPYSSAIVALLPQGGNLAGAQIVTYDSSGNAGAVLGTLPTLGQQGSSYLGVALSEGPLQAGMPALLIVSGQKQNGDPGQDLIAITPGTASSLQPVTNTLQ